MGLGGIGLRMRSIVAGLATVVVLGTVAGVALKNSAVVSVGTSAIGSALGKLTGHASHGLSGVRALSHGKTASAKNLVSTNNAPPPTPVVIDGVSMRYNPYKPSDGAYPSLALVKHLWIDVSVDQQLVYIMNGNHVLYTMVTSTGLDTVPGNSTPLGVYHVQAERGTWFYAPQYQMGAQYWVSWLGHGVFLFHSVTETIHHKLIPTVAAKLLSKASHGCFHLTIPDAQWVYNHIPYHTTVVVEQAPVRLLKHQIYKPSSEQKAAALTNPPGGANSMQSS
ncbi:L,D-transpeptidase [Ferroacidibacillus organovorans]|uniref:L,D-transpeptidase n=2 Tax=Ferroacidibacillus organovorans TaxID=1765683 RepID=A0A1V4EQ77_9BACL|nr:L,D-transpeptidase [Ferroacidibacillus organovorans]